MTRGPRRPILPGKTDSELLLAELRGEGKAIWMTTHDIFRAKEIADRVGIMVAGRLVKILSRAELEQEDLEQLYVRYVSQPTEQAA